MSTSVKKLLSQTAVYGLSSIVGRLLNYLLVPLYTRIFTTDSYGEISELYAYAGFLSVVLTFGMETAFFRFINKSEEKRNVYGTALWFTVCLNLLFFFLIVVGINHISQWMYYEKNKEYLIWFGLITALDAISSLPMAKLRHENKAVWFATVRLVDIGVNIGLNLFFYLILKKTDIQWVFVSNLVASAIRSIMLAPYFKNFSLSVDKELLKEMFSYAWPVLIIGLAGIINEMLDRMVLKYWLPGDQSSNLQQLGIYSACYKLSILMTLFIQAYRYAAEPYFFSESKNKNAPLLYASAMNIFVAVAMFSFLGVSLYMDVLKWFVGERFHGGLFIVPILLMANLFLGIHVNLSIWYKVTDNTQFGMYIAVVGAVLTITLNYFLIPILGFSAAAWTTLLCYAVMASLSYWFGQKNYPVPYKISLISSIIGIAVLLFVVFEALNYYLQMSIYVRLALATVLFLVYSLYIFGIRKKLYQTQ